MIAEIEAVLAGLMPNLRIADILDVLLVSFLLFLVVTWIRDSTSRSATRRMLVAVGFFVTVYILAHLFQMYLFEKVIQVLLLIALVSVIVVFQADIRRMLDRAGAWQPFRPARAAPPTNRVVDLITEAVNKLAEDCTGALIVVRGRDPWDQHVQGGVPLDGRVSQPLLYSIFDTETPGHDGAVLIEGDRVSRFAAHLPLASNLPAVSKYGGTRHAAALGLAEVTDAFVIVVSEERGTISVAEKGVLSEMESASELKGRLDRFWRRYYNPTEKQQAMWLSRRTLQNATVAVVMSVTLWLMFAYSPNTVLRTIEAPIEFRNLPPDWELVEQGALGVQVTLEGSEQAIRGIDPSQVAITLNASEPENGVNTYTIDRSDLNLPSNISIERIEPNQVTVTARPLKSVTVPVDVRFTGALPDSVELVEVRAEPDSVTLLIPETARAPRKADTEIIDLGRLPANGRVRSRIVLRSTFRMDSQDVNEITIQFVTRLRSANGRNR